MRLASKINAALIGAFACGTLATYGVLNSTIQPRFDELERAAAHENHARVTAAFDTFTEKLETATHDYAFWDETYSFVQGEGVEDFISSNLSPEFKAVENLGVNALIFLAQDGTVRFGAAYDLETKETMAGLVEEMAQFSFSHKFTQNPLETPAAERGLIRTSKGFVLVAIAPVLKSDGSGPAVGKVVSAKMLDVAAAKELTSVEFSLLELQAQTIAPAATAQAVSIATGREEILTTSTIKDLSGQPLVQLSVSTPRHVSQTGAMAIQSALIMMVLAGVASLCILWVFLQTEVVARLDSLRKHFVTAGSSGAIRSAASLGGNDEISDLAKSFNTMADQVNHLRDALADSSYMTGLSDWAAGTLHNVRNGLVPVATTTWQIEKLFDNAWVRNVETAAAEIKRADTAPERRQKLNEFLVGTASQLPAVAKEARDLTGQINGASRSVIDMVAEFERYAHRKTEIEAVDVLPLISGVAPAALGPQVKEIDLVLPSDSAIVSGNSVILRQVISNILINAVEAMANQPRRGRIEISLARQSKSTARISISDNGEGVAADRLQAIFERGVSSRRSRHGGLGLHWCANAVKHLGGNIRALSEGPGRGTTIVIELPTPDNKEREAA